MELSDRAYDAATLAASDVLNVVRHGGPKTRTELAAILGLARPTISLRVDPLLSLGLLSPVDGSLATGGRRAERLGLAPASRLLLAADIGTKHLRVAAVGLNHQILALERVAIDITQDPTKVLGEVVSCGRRALAFLGSSQNDLLAFGVGLPCPVDHHTGKPSNPPIMPSWQDYDVAGHLQAEFGVPVMVDNDVNIMALGERASFWPAVDNLVFVKVASGIGAGIISGGRLQHGASGLAGDFGHLKIPRAAGTRCLCGSDGCIAAVASGAALVQRLQAGGRKVTNAREISELVRQHDTMAIEAVRQAGRDIGEALVACTVFVNPAMIVVGGSLAESDEQLLAGIREVVYAKALPRFTDGLTIARARTPNVGVIGAAIMATDYAFSPPGVASWLPGSVALAVSGAAAR